MTKIDRKGFHSSISRPTLERLVFIGDSCFPHQNREAHFGKQFYFTAANFLAAYNIAW
jgi:hypothetical protein